MIEIGKTILCFILINDLFIRLDKMKMRCLKWKCRPEIVSSRWKIKQKRTSLRILFTKSIYSKYNGAFYTVLSISPIHNLIDQFYLKVRNLVQKYVQLDSSGSDLGAAEHCEAIPRDLTDWNVRYETINAINKQWRRLVHSATATLLHSICFIKNLKLAPVFTKQFQCWHIYL